MTDLMMNMPSKIYRELIEEKSFFYEGPKAIKIVIQQVLQEQIKDRWEHLRAYVHGYEPDESVVMEIEAMFELQGVSLREFAQAVKDILTGKKKKINTLRITGVINSCKSLIMQAISKPFHCCRLTMLGCGNEFYFNDMLSKSIVMIEELWITPPVCDDFKTILSGYPLSINMKGQGVRETLKHTPILLTSNYDRFGRGFVSEFDEKALLARCVSFKFTKEYEPKCNWSTRDVIYAICSAIE